MRSAEPTIMISLVEGSDAIAYVISVWSMELSCQSFHCSTFSNPNPNLPALWSWYFLSLTVAWACFFFQLFVSNDLWYFLICCFKISYCRTLLQVATQVSIMYCTSNAWDMYVLFEAYVITSCMMTNLMTYRSWYIRSHMCKYSKQRLEKTFANLCLVMKLSCSQAISWDFISSTKGAQQPYQLVSLPGHLFSLYFKLLSPPGAFVYQICWNWFPCFACLQLLASAMHISLVLRLANS